MQLRSRRIRKTINVFIEPLEGRRLLSGTISSPWQQADIGIAGLPGDASSSLVSKSNLAFSITGSGVGIFGGADSFHFVYQTMWGNGKIIAKVDSEAGSTNLTAVVGVMMRESLLPGARMDMIGVNAGNVTVFSQRMGTGDADSAGPFQTSQPAQWLKLVRSGNTFTSYVSSNRNNWKRANSIQISMTVNLEVGLCVSSSDQSQLETASLDNVQVTSLTPRTAAPGWHSAANAPLSLYESSSASVNGKLYVFGGFDDPQTESTAQSDVYDPATDSWTRIADMPYVVTHSGVAVVGTDVYFAGGFLGNWIGPNLTDQTNQVIKHDTLTNTWSNVTPLPASRAAGGLVAIGEQLHFFGGTDEFVQNDMPDHWMLDLSNPAAGWVPEAPMPNPRDHFGYTTLNGMIYAIGGEHLTDEINGNDSEVDQYNPATDTWTQLAPLPMALSHIHTNTIVVNHRIVILGGSANGTTAATMLSSVTEYNPKKNRWFTLRPLPEPRSAVVGRVVGNQIILSGGENELTPESTTWELDEAVLQRQLR